MPGEGLWPLYVSISRTDPFTFARKLTRDPASLADTDFAAIEREFGTSGAREMLLQTCGFNFMNRFTDGLNLPSEDEAIKTY
jgi:hypothetical protein